MLIFVEILLAASAVPLFCCSTILLLECVAACLPSRRLAARTETGRPRIAVLIPAHDEAAVLETTLTLVVRQLGENDRLLVVADNCSDETPAIAQACSTAEVLIRSDSTLRGKGFALQHGLHELSKSPPDVVVILDADTHPEPEAIPRLACRAAATNRPQQAVYLLAPPPTPSLRDLISHFAFLVKNLVRPTGLWRMGWPAPITGSGTAIPWEGVAAVRPADGHLVEDMQYGIDLAVAGWPPEFCPDAKVLGHLPAGNRAARDQRTRWEHGHVRVILTQAPRLIWQAVAQRRGELLWMAADQAIPPLSLLAIVGVVTFLAAVGAAAAGSGFALAAAHGVSLVLVLLAVAICWLGFAREQIPLRTLLLSPIYVLWKLPIYVALMLRPQRRWIRTPRES